MNGTEPLSRPTLLAAIAAGRQFDYLPFWGHSGTALRASLSQWYRRPFTVDGVDYASAEHYMMAGKARLFGDGATLERILATDDPSAAKRLGREVQHYDEQSWRQHRFEIVLAGNLAKFGQHRDLHDFLLGTGHQILVEASPVDRIWGIGLAADHPDAANPARWQGDNLLGFALMQVRQQLREQGK
ncbi:NADAR family protein [Chitinimonas lacunae]|uniref:NADAR family protein n=1 Tax=Chitinimonas lacunae TaxID=1963018 RepID=A0ABV8MRW2_9NEIS